MAVVVGALDSSSFLYPIIGISELVFYSSLIILKIIIFLLSSGDFRQSVRFFPFLCVTIISVTSSSILNQSIAIEPFKILSVCLSIIITLSIIRDNISSYAGGMAISGYIICASYIALVQADGAQTTGSRYHFFEGQHPNLGGEMVLATLIMSTLFLQTKAFLLLLSASLYCAYLWQSRTSIIAICIAAVCYFIVKAQARFGWRQTVWGTGAAIALLFVIVNVFAIAQSETVQGALSFVLDSVLLVEDQYRGGESGLSGRDAHWLEAIRVFADHPFFGAGPNFMERLAVPQPHNWVLYALAQFGVFGFVLTAMFATAAVNAVRRDPIRLLAIIPFFVPWLLNDRFLNFNVYPFALYIVVFASFGRTSPLPRMRPPPLKPSPRYSSPPGRWPTR